MLWTIDHLEILTRLWPSRSASNIGNIVGRSDKAIRRKANILGLARKKNGKAAIVWKPEKNEALIKAWLAGDSIRTIATALKVSHPSILKHASRLGLKGRPRISENWTAEKVERLKELWPLKEFPAVAIGEKIGMSKKAVIGKAWRLKLPTKNWSNQYTGKPKVSAIKTKVSRNGGGRSTTKGMRAALRVVELKQIATRVDPVVSLNVGLLDLQEFHCRWVTGTGDDGLATYCGHEKAYRSYCAHHCRIAYETVAMRRARAKLKEAA